MKKSNLEVDGVTGLLDGAEELGVVARLHVVARYPHIYLTPHLNNFSAEAEFIDLDWGDKVNSGIALSYRPVRLHGLAGWCDNPMPALTLSHCHRIMNSATGLLLGRSSNL